MLRSLLLSPDENTIRVMGRIFKELDVEVEHFSEPTAAIADAAKTRYDAIVLDDTVSHCHTLLAKILELPSCNKSVRILLAEPHAAMHSIFKSGTQIVLYKPLSVDRVRHGLRAVRNLMARDRRRGIKRVSTIIQARMSVGKMAMRDVLITDLSDSGAAITYEEGNLSTAGKLRLDFALTEDTDIIQAAAELVWQDSQGSAGLRFIDMASSGRKRLAQWLKIQSSERKFRVEVLAAHSSA
jgi:hypothetical protein